MSSETKLLIGSDMIASKDILNPFVHHLELTSTYDKFKTAFFTIVVLPVRIMAILVLLFIAWLLATIGLAGVSQTELSEKPLTGWRRCVRSAVYVIVRLMFGAVGFHRVRTVGEQATRQQAPVLAVAPHSSFYDGLAAVVTGGPTIVAKEENSFIPIVGRVINFTQPVYVRRDDPESRHNTIQEIIRRVKSDQDWPQILIFPEGTCTNRSCLITFKPGAFYPAVPVQPVLLRYPNKLDTVTWTWDGPGALKLLWLTMTQPTTTVEVEFLPVYVPSEYEKQNPKAFAEGVRNVMAKALAVPTADYTYDDCRVAVKAGQLGLPMTSNLITVERLRSRLGLTRIKIEDSALVKNMLSFQNRESQPVDLAEFANSLNVTAEDGSLVSLFKMHLENEHLSTIDFKKYLLAEYILQKATSKDDLIILAFKLYGEYFDKEMFEYVLNLVYNLPKSEASVIYNEMTDKPNEIKLSDYLNYGKKYPEKMESLQNHSKNSAHRTVTDFSSCGQSFHGAMDDNKKYQ
ncbi:lysophosphatidylcholine acyltransferase isoform X1 [Aphis gossypii]|uniref:lysophosphatidylcholine acyltransferase isoform X1 n=1 Tax=Aphis gossypii TaxID=80765 RepID=UPI00100EAD2D|nr:lysophosphatidylcholine acyltransferase isoform X1 [Aphis gossypii]XP_027850889.1 lysophosphatidylcholine acyltransferase isoform X1 [Aphis gossypii]XP_027850890.1 lysophosphatidylcholine acyltransferase isoform X1 [Aphis gossypii]XP_027850891.1 lysophosphatidylcholine acyltransferase isoform X1 [Aphis gossypii]